MTTTRHNRFLRGTWIPCAFWLLGVSLSPAAVIYSGLRNIPIATTFDGTYLDMATGNTTGSLTATTINFFFGGYGIATGSNFQLVRTDTGNLDPVMNLAPGTLVSSANPFATGDAGSDSHMGGGAGRFAAGTEGYVGFQLNTGGGPYYGWMRVDLTYNLPGAVVVDWAFDNTGGSLQVGSLSPVPEPSPDALIGIGLSGVLLRRNRRPSD